MRDGRYVVFPWTIFLLAPRQKQTSFPRGKVNKLCLQLNKTDISPSLLNKPSFSSYNTEQSFFFVKKKKKPST